MITRIIMDKDILTPRKKFIKGQVYDSRIPMDTPEAADGVQHSIERDLLDRFVEEGWAHEETWDEWVKKHPKFRMAGEAA